MILVLRVDITLENLSEISEFLNIKSNYIFKC